MYIVTNLDETKYMTVVGHNTFTMWPAGAGGRIAQTFYTTEGANRAITDWEDVMRRAELKPYPLKMKLVD
jgi:hypothetical protein